MSCFYLEESKEKCKYKLNYIFNRINIEENKIILPIKDKQNLSNKKAKKFVQKIKSQNVRIVALSENLNSKQNLKNELYANNIDILNGRYLFKLLIEEIIKYICSKSNIKEEEAIVSILTNEPTITNKQIILNLAEKVKTLGIITNHINEFQCIEDYLYNEKGIVIKVSNNKQKDLLKNNIIINIDFCEEEVNKYNIYSKCAIININNEVKIKTKKFNGINVNNYNITMPKRYKIKNFNDKIIYESKIFNLEYNNARRLILNDKIKIKSLIGEKGVLSKQELKHIK